PHNHQYTNDKKRFFHKSLTCTIKFKFPTMVRAFVLLFMLVVSLVVSAQKKKGSSGIDQWKKQAAAGIQEQYNRYKDIAFTIWDYAELGYKEEKSSGLLQQTLKQAGFDVNAGVAGIPTAFVASYGSGDPVIGIL